MPQIFSSERPTQRRAKSNAPSRQQTGESLSALQSSADASPAQRKLSDLQQMAVQRMDDEELMGKAKPGGLEVPVQRMDDMDDDVDDDMMQGKAAQGGLQQSPAQLQEAAGGNGGLPGGLRSGIENLSGVDMSDVQVHYNSSKPAQLNAHAYAQGTDIHLASGQEKHLGHEAWHVVQQKQGRVEPTMELGGVSINDDAGLEAEADNMGARAAQTQMQRKN
ncbi:MAG: DUF4157 domain-containing protein [Roseobacter sp.]